MRFQITAVSSLSPARRRASGGANEPPRGSDKRGCGPNTETTWNKSIARSERRRLVGRLSLSARLSSVFVATPDITAETPSPTPTSRPRSSARLSERESRVFKASSSTMRHVEDSTHVTVLAIWQKHKKQRMAGLLTDDEWQRQAQSPRPRHPAGQLTRPWHIRHNGNQPGRL